MLLDLVLNILKKTHFHVSDLLVSSEQHTWKQWQEWSRHPSPLLVSTVQCLEMTTKRKLIGRLVPCRCFRGEEEVISVLDYSHCSLQQVPKEIFSFERTLEELYLDANQIEELPKVKPTLTTSVPFNRVYIIRSPSPLSNIICDLLSYSITESKSLTYVSQFM